MAIDKSIQGLGDFAKRAHELVKDIIGKKDELSALADRLDRMREDAEALAKELPTGVQFRVVNEAAVKAKQKEYHDKLRQVADDIVAAKDDPGQLQLLYTKQAALHVGLGNTYNALAPRVVEFSGPEIAELTALLQQATLDANKRQQQAAVLHAGVDLVKFAFKVATRLAA